MMKLSVWMRIESTANRSKQIIHLSIMGKFPKFIVDLLDILPNYSLESIKIKQIQTGAIMLAEVRRNRIVGLVEQYGWMHIDELAEKLDISLATVRRDLAQLEDEHHLVRKRGGAVSINRPLVKERAYHTKSMDHPESKRLIAMKAATLIEPGMSLFLDAGTTVFELVHFLEDIDDLTVITSDLRTALQLCNLSIELYFLGGMVQRETCSVISNLSDGAFDFSVDIAFFGAPSVNNDCEVFSPTQLKASLKRLVAQQANQSYLLVDESKFGKRSLFRVGSLADYTAVITDKQFSDREQRQLSSLNARVISINSDSNGLSR